MDSFLRPEIAAWLRHWSETLAAAAVAALGAWWSVSGGPVLSWAGAALALVAAAAAFVAYRRARFRSPGGGVGVVTLDEGRLTYFGPLTGGSIVVREIVSVGIDPRHKPAHWVVRDAETELFIPVDAEGADVLLDVFALLPRLDLGAVLGARARARGGPTTLWRQGGGTVPEPLRLPRGGRPRGN